MDANKFIVQAAPIGEWADGYLQSNYDLLQLGRDSDPLRPR
jgi:hypothetical protein